MNAIEVDHLKKSFGDFQAVQDASSMPTLEKC